MDLILLILIFGFAVITAFAILLGYMCFSWNEKKKELAFVIKRFSADSQNALQEMMVMVEMKLLEISPENME